MLQKLAPKPKAKAKSLPKTEAVKPDGDQIEAADDAKQDPHDDAEGALV